MYSFGRLRPLESNDLELMLSWRNTPVVREKMFTRHEISFVEHKAWWKRIEKREDQQYFMMVVKGKRPGVVGFNEIDIKNRNSCWGFYVSPEAVKGTGTILGYLALEHAFDTLGLHKLYGEALAYNVAGLEMHKRLGFKVEGIFREHHMVDNDLIDVHRMGILAEEWDSLRESVRNKINSFIVG